MWTLTVSLTSNPAEPNMSLLLRTPVLIPQSHRPNWHETDLKPTKIIKFGERSDTVGIDSVLSVWCRFMFGPTNLSGEIFQTCLKDLSPTNCRLYVGYMSVWCRFCRGAFGDVSVLIRPPMVDGLSVLNRLCIGHMSADLTPIQDRIKSDITPNWVESADTFPNKNRRVPDTSRTQTECKPIITVCGVIPYI